MEEPITPAVESLTPPLAALVAKLARVAGGYVQKKGRNTSQNYNYASAADIAGNIGPKLAAEGVIMARRNIQLEWVPTEDKRATKVRMSLDYVFTDGMAEIAIPAVAEAIDYGDKALYKAQTGALKYALMQTFLLEAGDDPEADDDSATKDKTTARKTKPEPTVDKSTSQEPVPEPAATPSGGERITPAQAAEITQWAANKNQNLENIIKYLQGKDPSIKRIEDAKPEHYQLLKTMWRIA